MDYKDAAPLALWLENGLTLALIPAFSPGRRRIGRRFLGISCGGVGRKRIEQTRDAKGNVLSLGRGNRLGRS